MTSHAEDRTTDQRTKYEADLDVQYARCFNDMNERFYRRLDGIFSFITILGGSGAFAAFLSGHPATSGIAGLIIAGIGYIDREIRPAYKAEKCAQQRRKLGKLSANIHSMSFEDIDKRLRILQANGPATITAIEPLAFNQNLASNGFTTGHLPIPLLSRLASWLI